MTYYYKIEKWVPNYDAVLQKHCSVEWQLYKEKKDVAAEQMQWIL